MAPILKVDGVTKRFGGLVAVDNVSFEVEEGEVFALIGPNGAGKTTLFNCVTGFYKPTFGRVTFRGRDVTGFPPHRTAKAGIARTFQNIRLFDYMSAIDNVRLGHHCRMHSKLWDSLFKTPFERGEERRITEHSMELLALVGLDRQADNYARNLAYGQRSHDPRARDHRLLDRARHEGRHAGVTAHRRPRPRREDRGGSACGSPQQPAGDRGLPGQVRLMALLEVSGIDVFYGRVAAVRGATLSVDRGEVVALIGSNGAGKTTTLRTISGLLHPQRGTIKFDGQDITHTPPQKIVNLGICQSPEGRRLFTRMSVLDNLRMGAYTRSNGAEIKADMDRVFELFPRLKERANQIAGTLSGGEQQMCAMGRALMAKPKVLMLDEPSLGLSPILVETIFSIVREINAQGTPVLLVEQNANKALDVAHRGYVLETGSIVKTGTGKELLASEDVQKAYLGM